MLYFIAAGTEAMAIKIGYTADATADTRLATLQTGNHLPLFLLAFGPGTLADEQELHTLHRADNIRGEWFKPTTAVLMSASRLGLADKEILQQGPLSTDVRFGRRWKSRERKVHASLGEPPCDNCKE